MTEPTQLSKRERERRYHADYYVKNRRRIRLRQNLKPRGLTLEQFDEMMKQQGGVCAICGKPDLGKTYLAVDHDHRTNKVRGLLCNKHNRALGFMGDDPMMLRKAAEYLERHRAE